MAKKTDSVAVRVLANIFVDGKAYKPDTLLVLPEGTAKALGDDFQVDANPAAVEYLKSLGVEPVVHEKPADAVVEEAKELQGE